MRSFWLCERFYGKNLVLSTLPNCPECVAREKKALKKQYEMEAAKAEEEDKDYFIPSDRDIGSDIEIPMKLDPSTKHFVCKRCGLYAHHKLAFQLWVLSSHPLFLPLLYVSR